VSETAALSAGEHTIVRRSYDGTSHSSKPIRRWHAFRFGNPPPRSNFEAGSRKREKEEAMRESFWVIGLTLVVSAVASAQDVPRLEVFGGYSYVQTRGYIADEFVPGSGSGEFPPIGSKGWTGSVAVNATQWLAVVAEASGLHADLTWNSGGTPSTLSMHDHSYLFGPRFTYRSGRWSIFVHALFGEAHASTVLSAPEVLVPLGFVETKAAIGMGTGVDFTAYTRRRHRTDAGQQLAIRLGQIDWLRTNFTASHQNNFRLSAGLVFRF
jgi:hypothetical protein